jgi:predicted Zn finger-like uncharacterized protein
MKFVCDTCQAQYMIADEKVGGRGVKVKCKKCGNTIVVRPEGASKGDGKSSRTASSTRNPAVEAGKGARTLSSTTLSSSQLESLPGIGGDTLAEGSELEAPPPARSRRDEEDETAVNIPNRASASVPKTEDGNLATSLDGAPVVMPPAAPAFAEEKATLPAMDVPAAARALEASMPTVVANDDELKAAVEKHRMAAAAEAAPPSAPAPNGDNKGDLENELAGAFDGLFGAEGGENVDRRPTRVYSSEQLDMARAQAEGAKNGAARANGASMARAAPVATPEPPKAEKPAVEWYAAIQDEQRGPMPLAEMESHWIKGAIDRESLVWRTGMPDWIPLKEVKDLKYLMDVAPQKKAAPPSRASTSQLPVQAAPSSSSGMGALSGVGLMPAQDDASEESWRPRGMTSVYKAATAAEASVAKSSAPEPAMAAPEAKEDSTWTPTAASALASLVDDELSSMKGAKAKGGKGSSQAPHKAEEPAFRPPPAEDDSIEAHLPSLMGASGVKLPSLSLPPPAPESSATNPARSHTSIPTPLSASMGPSPAASLPFAPAHGGGGNTMLKVMAGVGGLAFLAVCGVAIAAMTGAFSKPDRQVVASNTNPNPVTNPPPAQPPAQQQPPPVAAQPPANTPPPQQPVAVAGGTPTNAATQQPAGQASSPPPAQKAKDDKPPPEEHKATRPVKEKAAKAERVEREKPEKVEKPEKQEKRFAAVADDPPPREEPKKEKPVRAAKKDDCDPILYPEGCDEKSKKAAPSGGGGGGGKETLSKTDILTVVKANKGDISKCVADQRKKDAAKAEGVIKMTWTIRKDGKTSAVTTASPEFADVFVGKCLTRAIQGWKFDAYTGEEIKPITFPFKLDQF